MSTPQLVEAVPALGSRLYQLGLAVRRGHIRTALPALQLLHLDPAQHLTSTLDEAALIGLLVECQLAQGDVEGAVLLGARLDGYLEGVPLVAAVAHYTRGEIAAARGETDLAIDHFHTTGAALLAVGECLELPWRCGMALALLHAGRRREALDLARTQHRVALAHGTATDLALALRTLATTDADADRVSRLRAALALLESRDAERLRAQIATDLAGLLVLGGETDESLRLLRAAEELASHQGLWPLQGRVRRLLTRLGEVPHRREDEALSVLTAAEQRVAVLVSDGLTNRQVAERLGVSIKAVEGHLSRTYRKLGLTSRAGLVATIGPPAERH